MTLAFDFRNAVEHNNIAQALDVIERLDDAPDPNAFSHPDDAYALMDFAIAHERVQIVEAFARRFKTLSRHGRTLSKYALYESFAQGKIECAQALQHLHPAEVFFCLPKAVENDHLHMLENFLPPFNPDSVDVTRLLINAWQYNSPQCFKYLLPQCLGLDTNTMEESLDPQQRHDFVVYVQSQRQKSVLLTHVDGGSTRARKL